MARVGYLKEYRKHGVYSSTYDYIDVYDSKDGFGYEKAMCVKLKDGSVGYIPLTESDIRGSKIRIIGKDSKPYRVALHKKFIENEIAYCIADVWGQNEYCSIGEDYVKLSVNGATANSKCSISFEFFDANGNNISLYKLRTERDLDISILANAYLTFSGYGNYYSFQYDNKELFGELGTYTNQDVLIKTKFNYTKADEIIKFRLGATTPNSGNAIINKITFKNITVGGKSIPIKIVT